MFETGIRQFRMAMAMVSGRRISPRLVERLIEDANATLREFGTPGDDVGQLLEGPFADAEQRTHFQTQALRRTARRLAAQSPFYAALFDKSGIDAGKIELTGLAGIRPTTKADLVGRASDFRCADSPPHLSTRTTGTTGRPAEIWLSVYESRLWPAMAALSGLLRNEINPADCLQVNLSSRATAAVLHDIEVCRLVGARSRALGLIPVEQSLDSLLDDAGGGAPTILGAYPSYLAQLVALARRRGLGPADFALRRADVAGEVLSASLSRAVAATFGCEVTDTFAMTEVLPVSGRTCELGHLHPDLNMGLVEVVRLDADEPADPGELGRLVVTPYFPYRDCMPVFRYDTQDLVRRLPGGPTGCSLAGIPAVSALQGKAGQLIGTPAGPVTPRDIIEIVESLPTQPWPARYRAGLRDGRLRIELPLSAVAGLTTGEIAARFAARGIDCEIRVVGDDDPLRHVRADLLESTFATAAVPTGV